MDALYGTPRVEGWASYMPVAEEVRELLGASLGFPVLLGAVEEAVAGQIAP
jgi:hypothetical protein